MEVLEAGHADVRKKALGCFTGCVWVRGLSSREELGVENYSFTNPPFG